MPGTEKRYVIVGGSAAGMAAACAIREQDRGGRVTIYSEEPDAPYFRPLIPFLVSGKKNPRDMAMKGRGPYTKEKIEICLNARVHSIDPPDRSVVLENGDSIPYDKLLLATGSSPFVPPDTVGTDMDGVFAVRKLSDARKVAERARGAKHAVMLGGGLLNLKMAFALLERGLAVTLVVYSPEVLSQLMEPEDAGLIRDALDRAGLKITTGASAKKILANGSGVCSVGLADGSEMACDLVCIGKGVQPNVDSVGADAVTIDRGVVVDRFTATSAEHVYAAGDVAVTFDPISNERIVTGLWTNAVEMGRCAGYNMAGRPVAYAGTFGILNATQVAEQPFVSMGLVHTAGTELETHVTATRDAYRKVVFSADGSRLVGVLLVGDIAKAGLYRFVIRERMDARALKEHIIRQSLHYGHFLQT